MAHGHCLCRCQHNEGMHTLHAYCSRVQSGISHIPHTTRTRLELHVCVENYKCRSLLVVSLTRVFGIMHFNEQVCLSAPELSAQSYVHYSIKLDLKVFKPYQ